MSENFTIWNVSDDSSDVALVVIEIMPEDYKEDGVTSSGIAAMSPLPLTA